MTREQPRHPSIAGRATRAVDAIRFPAVQVTSTGALGERNASFAALTGWLDDDRPPFEVLFCADTDATVSARVREAIATRALFVGEVLCQRRNGTLFWNDLLLLPSPIEGGDATELFAIFRDVTSRRTAASALDLRAAHDRLVLDRIQAGIVVHRATTEILYANAKATELLGVTHDTVLGAVNTDPRWGFIGADGTPLAIDEYPVGKAVRTRAVVRDLLIGITRSNDGKLVWLMCNAYPVMSDAGDVSEVVVSFTDVTVLKQTERALQKSEERLRLVLEGSRDAPWDWEIETNAVYYSPRWLEMVGYAHDDLALDAALWVRLLHPEDRERVTGTLERHMAEGASTYEIEFRLQHKAGHLVSVLSRGFILRDAAGRPLRVSGTNTDVTERRALEAQLQQARKMEAIGQLAGGVAHDFNNLLAVITGNLELLRAELADTTAGQESLDEALAAARRGADLTRRLLTFSRQQPMQLDRIDLARTLGDLGRVIARLIGENIRVEVRIPNGLPTVRTDETLLENAVLNLAINARDAMPTGGSLRFTAHTVRIGVDERESAPELAAGDYVCLAVTDTGQGMPPEVLQRAMEPFFTTKPLGRGTGLGLSSIYGFMRQTGGHLTLESAVGAGTTARLFFPVDTGTKPTARAGSIPLGAAQPARSGARILVVEDDEAVRALAVRSVEALGHRALEAADGREALALLESTPGVDLVLTDVIMPNEMTGPSLAAEIVRRWPSIKVVFVSGYTAGVLDAGSPLAHPLLPKPYALSDLARVLTQELDAARSGPGPRSSAGGDGHVP